MKSAKRLCLLNTMRNVGGLCQRFKIMKTSKKKHVSVEIYLTVLFLKCVLESRIEDDDVDDVQLT